MERLNYDTIKSYQSFSTIEDMDQSVRGFLYVHKSSLSEGTKKVLNFIWRHSVKIIGVSFAKYDTIANEVELNRRTVIRCVKTLESLGILKKISTSRMNRKQGVNLLIIQQFEQVDDLFLIICHPMMTPLLSLLIKQKINKDHSVRIKQYN